jgi:hypothetical protein
MGVVSRYAATRLIFALFPGHSDIISVRAWHTDRDRNSFGWRRKIENQTT